MGFSWGFSSWYDELRDYLEMYDDEVGLCYPITTAIATSSYDSGLMQAGCYKKGTLPEVSCRVSCVRAHVLHAESSESGFSHRT